MGADVYELVCELEKRVTVLEAVLVTLLSDSLDGEKQLAAFKARTIEALDLVKS